MAELTYMKNGDYLIPDLILDDEDEMEEYPLGKYGMLREIFLNEHHHGTYMSMLLTDRLTPTCGNTQNESHQTTSGSTGESQETEPSTYPEEESSE